MHIIKKIVRWLAAASLGLWLLLLAGTVNWLMTVGRPATVKGWLKDSGVYNRVVDVATTQFAKNTEGHLDIDASVLKAAVQKALPPESLKQLSENFIDGIYHWLEGRVSTPDFRLDFTGAKDTFVAEVSAYTKNKLSALPPCKANSLPDPETDLLKLTCLPKGINVDAEVNKQAEKIFNTEGSNVDLVVTADDLANKDGEKNPFAADNPAPRLFQAMRQTPYVFAFLAVLSLALVAWLNEDKHRALRVIARSFLTIGVLLLISGILMRFLVSHGTVKTPGPDDLVGSLGVPILREGLYDYTRIQLWFGGIYTIVAIGLYILVKQFLPKPVNKEEVALKQPQPTH